MAAFAGTWTLASTENMDTYMDALSVPQDLRKLMDTIDIGVSEDSWTHSSSEGNVTIKVGEMGDYTHRGHTMKGKIKSVGEKVVEEHMLGDVQVDVVREIINNQMCVCFTAKGVTAKIFYNKK